MFLPSMWTAEEFLENSERLKVLYWRADHNPVKKPVPQALRKTAIAGAPHFFRLFQRYASLERPNNLKIIVFGI